MRGSVAGPEEGRPPDASHLLAMPPPPPGVSKIRLSILLLFLQIFVYLYVVPREETSSQEKKEDPGDGGGGGETKDEMGYPLEPACKADFPELVLNCIAGSGYFRVLSENCGRKPVLQTKEEEPPPPPSPDEGQTTGQNHSEQKQQDTTAASEPPVEASSPPVKVSTTKMEAPPTEKSTHLIYQIIVVMLFLSVSFALADCFQERARKKANPEGGERQTDGSLSRRMSLADLTLSRHARKESQASYRPLGKPRRLCLLKKSMSADVNLNANSSRLLRSVSQQQYNPYNPYGDIPGPGNATPAFTSRRRR